MTAGDPEVSTTRYDWRSANIGPDRIEVNTSDSKFKAKMEEDGGPVYYFIGVLPYFKGHNTMNVQLTLIEASKDAS
jgi:hypothetical protein